MFGIGHQELIVIFLIVFFIFGAKRIPELGRGLGQAIHGFRNAGVERPQIETPHEVNNQESKASPKNQL